MLIDPNISSRYRKGPFRWVAGRVILAGNHRHIHVNRSQYFVTLQERTFQVVTFRYLKPSRATARRGNQIIPCIDLCLVHMACHILMQICNFLRLLWAFKPIPSIQLQTACSVACLTMPNFRCSCLMTPRCYAMLGVPDHLLLIYF